MSERRSRPTMDLTNRRSNSERRKREMTPEELLEACRSTSEIMVSERERMSRKCGWEQRKDERTEEAANEEATEKTDEEISEEAAEELQDAEELCEEAQDDEAYEEAAYADGYDYEDGYTYAEDPFDEDDAYHYKDERTPWERFIDKHFRLMLLFCVLCIIGFFTLLFGAGDQGEDSPAQYAGNSDRAPEIVYVSVGNTVRFDVGVNAGARIVLEEEGKVNLGIEYAGMVDATAEDICSVNTDWTEDSAHRNAVKEYCVTGKDCGTVTLNFDLRYDRYRIGKNNKFSDRPVETYVSQPWTSVVVSVHPAIMWLEMPYELIQIREGAEFDLQVKVTPEEGKYAPLRYTSSDESIVRVDETGCVYAVAPGKAVITVGTGSSAVSPVKCTVEVLPTIYVG